MTPELRKDHYQVIPNFLKPERAQNLAQKFIAFHSRQTMQSDDQVLDAPAQYNFMPFLNLLVEKTPIVRNLILEPVLPTYTYARIYRRGNVLKRHKDREACEISLTINLKGDRDWPIYFEVPGKTPVLLNLRPGDAALYLGCDTYHWRDPFQGEEYVQVFLHYVRADGPCAFAYFDKEKVSPEKKALEMVK